MEIKTGPDKGYFYLPLQEVNDGSLVRTDTVYSRFRLPNNKQIHGFNSTYLPYLDGFYYIPKNTQIDTRKLAFALENKLMPSSGNTETFEHDFDNIVVPDNYCPYYLKPCSYDWCERCKELKRKKRMGIRIESTVLTKEQLFKRNEIIWVFCLLLGAIFVLSAVS